ncbi:MAG: hypothetical protein PVH48_00145 [Cyclobacteriaceae bacterium]|jgi:hypothetical protein
MKKRIGKHYRILIIKKITDSLTEVESAELNRYLNTNSHAKQYYTDLKKVWDITYTLAASCTFKIDMSEEWKKFMRSQNLTSQKTLENE